MKIQFATTFEKELIEKLKIEAIKSGKNVNNILEALIKMYLGGEIKLKEENV